MGELVADNVKILSGPGNQYAYMAQFSTGFIMEVIGKSEDGLWLVVKMPGGEQGWIETEYITVQTGPGELLAFAPPPVPPPTNTPEPFPKVVVNPSSGNPKTIYTITITGFNPAERIVLSITFEATGQTVYSWKENGYLWGDRSSWTIRVQSSLYSTPGRYIVSAAADSGRSAQAVLEVLDKGE